MRSDRTRIITEANAFGSWSVTRWAARPPEAPMAMFVLRWKSGHDHGHSVHPTRTAALDAVPFTNEEYKTCPMDTTTHPPTARSATDR